MVKHDKLEYTVKLEDALEFLRQVFGSQENVLANIRLYGDGFVLYLGNAIPQEGVIDSVSIDLPKLVSVDDARWLIKRRVEIGYGD